MAGCLRHVGGGWLNAFLRVAVGGVVGLGIYALVALALGLPELQAVRRRFSRFFPSR